MEEPERSRCVCERLAIERGVDLAAVVTLGKCKVESVLSPVGI